MKRLLREAKYVCQERSKLKFMVFALYTMYYCLKILASYAPVNHRILESLVAPSPLYWPSGCYCRLWQLLTSISSLSAVTVRLVFELYCKWSKVKSNYHLNFYPVSFLREKVTKYERKIRRTSTHSLVWGLCSVQCSIWCCQGPISAIFFKPLIIVIPLRLHSLFFPLFFMQ